MDIKNLLIGGALLASPFLAVAAPCANAAVINVTGNFTISESATYGTAPGISTPSTDKLSTISGSSSPFSGSLGSLHLNLNGASTTYNFITLSPRPLSGSCGSSCENYGGVHRSVAISEITAAFTGITIDGAGATSTDNSDTGTFQADYASTTNGGLICTTSSGTDTDCITWSADNDPIVFTADTASEDYTLDIALNNASDWDIVPTITFTLTGTDAPSPVPEPGTLAIFATALAMLGLIRRPRATL
jgi:hypothetical protein